MLMKQKDLSFLEGERFSLRRSLSGMSTPLTSHSTPPDASFGPKLAIRSEPMSRRRAPRRARRLQVRFWKPGEPHAFTGYTTNLSTTGMFVATNSPLPQGARIRIEVVERDRSFVMEGVVAHARRVRSELMRISQSGMGVRFLTVEELVRELLPAVSTEVEGAPAAAAAQELDVTPTGIGGFGGMGEPLSPAEAAAAAAAPPAPAPPPVSAQGSFCVQFASAKDFLEVFYRDIVNGGLFISTRHPGKIQEIVQVELQLPDAAAEPVRFRGRVVQRYDPRSEDLDDTNLLSGMGLELLDLPAVIEQLRPLVQRLKG